jgi:hypothetical protein
MGTIIFPQNIKKGDVYFYSYWNSTYSGETENSVGVWVAREDNDSDHDGAEYQTDFTYHIGNILTDSRADIVKELEKRADKEGMYLDSWWLENLDEYIEEIKPPQEDLSQKQR